jgi:2-amino-4-hydroxy-6-hydroxymethyldihydropteridine diphosphokinase
LAEITLISQPLTKNTFCGLLLAMNSVVFVGLGSNQGDRELNLLRAVAEIGKLPGSRITALSGFYDTEAVGPIVQDPFLNAVLRIETSLTPNDLLSELQRIETETFRRKRTVPQGPRSMDLDILLFDELVLEGGDLTIPHPRLHERRFVLVPLAEIAPETIHPLLKKSCVQLLDQLESTDRVNPI